MQHSKKIIDRLEILCGCFWGKQKPDWKFMYNLTKKEEEGEKTLKKGKKLPWVLNGVW